MQAVKFNFEDPGYTNYQRSRREKWEKIAGGLDQWKGWGGYYYRRLREIYSHLISPNQSVLEIGCGQGDLLAHLKPSTGVGVDFSGRILEIARKKHPEISFIQEDAHEISLDEKFDFIILSDLVNDLWDVQTVLDQARRLSTPRTRIIINAYSRLWEFPRSVTESCHLAKPLLTQNWLDGGDITNLLNLAGFDLIRSWQEILLPFPVPLLAPFCNKFLVHLWPFNKLALTNFFVARPRYFEEEKNNFPRVSVVVPARNEAGNIANIFERTPKMGGETELVFVEGHSKDDTFETIQREIELHPEKPAVLFRQTGIGKADAMKLGFEKASGEVLMILDADLTVPPEDLPKFYEALVSGKGEFINGVRLVYPMEKQAMQFLNLLGNKLFGVTFSWMIGQPVKDTLCGTKVLWRSDYERIAANRSYFGDFDPFGDFDLLFGASRMNLKIVDLPIRYRERVYGSTNIQRWKHGWLLIKMVLFAASRLKFI